MYVTSGMIGVDLDSVTAGTTTDGAGAKYTLGQRVSGNNNSEHIYVQAGAAISTTTSEPYALAVTEALKQATSIARRRKYGK